MAVEPAGQRTHGPPVSPKVGGRYHPGRHTQSASEVAPSDAVVVPGGQSEQYAPPRDRATSGEVRIGDVAYVGGGVYAGGGV